MEIIEKMQTGMYQQYAWFFFSEFTTGPNATNFFHAKKFHCEKCGRKYNVEKTFKIHIKTCRKKKPKKYSNVDKNIQHFFNLCEQQKYFTFQGKMRQLNLNPILDFMELQHCGLTAKEKKLFLEMLNKNGMRKEILKRFRYIGPKTKTISNENIIRATLLHCLLVCIPWYWKNLNLGHAIEKEYGNEKNNLMPYPKTLMSLTEKIKKSFGLNY